MMWVLPLVAAILCSIGFKKFVWFISIGYGAAVAGEGIAMIFMFWNRLTVATVIILIVLIGYACRLAGFLTMREIKSASYRKVAKEITKDGSDMSFGVKCAIWISVICLYFCQVSPIFYRLSNGTASNAWHWLGLIVMLLGVTLEATADMQKSAAKKKNANRFCDTGLFRLVRCPNYLGELLLWVGVFISGFGALTGVVQWFIAVLGFVCITYIMFSGARRLELRQNKRYGNDPEYQKYVKTTPIIIPFIPLYSVADCKFIIV